MDADTAGDLFQARSSIVKNRFSFIRTLSFVLRYRSMRPAVARDALLATHGGLSLELCAVLYHISPMALYRLVCALGHQGLVTVLTRCGLALPIYQKSAEDHERQPVGECQKLKRITSFRVPRASARGYLLLGR
jgi:hypothetical protein